MAWESLSEVVSNHTPTNGSHSLSHSKSRIHTRPHSQERTQRLTRANRACFRWGVVSVPSTCATRSEISARAAVRRAYFAIFAWVDGTLKKSREPSEQRRALCASLFRGVAVPQGRAAPLLVLALYRRAVRFVIAATKGREKIVGGSAVLSFVAWVVALVQRILL